MFVYLIELYDKCICGLDEDWKLKVKYLFIKYVALFLLIDEDVGRIVNVRYKIEIGIYALVNRY